MDLDEILKLAKDRTNDTTITSSDNLFIKFIEEYFSPIEETWSTEGDLLALKKINDNKELLRVVRSKNFLVRETTHLKIDDCQYYDEYLDYLSEKCAREVTYIDVTPFQFETMVKAILKKYDVQIDSNCDMVRLSHSKYLRQLLWDVKDIRKTFKYEYLWNLQWYLQRNEVITSNNIPGLRKYYFDYKINPHPDMKILKYENESGK